MFASAAALAFACLLCGCFIDIDFGGTGYQCTDGVCPTGFTCINEMCVENGGGDDGGTGTDAGGDAGNPASCGGAAALGYSFDGDLLWAETEQSGGATVTQTGGKLEIVLPAAPTGQAQGSFYSHMNFDLRGDALWLQIPQMVNTATTANVEFVITGDWSGYAEFIQSEGTLFMNAWEGGTAVSSASLPYDPDQHRWWRFREEGGMLYWDTSHDGGQWTNRHAYTAPAYAARAGLWFSAYSSAADGGTVLVDNLNGGSAPREPWCAMTNFSDDFADEDEGYDWRGWDTNCVRRMRNGTISFTPDADLVADCGYEMLTAWDLTGSSAHIEVPEVVTATDATTWFAVHDYNDRNASINIQNGEVGLWLCAASCNQVKTFTYSATDHRWLRISESSGELIWSTSPDGASWTEQHRQSHNLTVTQMSVSLGVSMPSGAPSPGQSVFDNYNVTP